MFIKRKTKTLFGLFFFCGILTWGFGVSADTLFTDDFNSYGLGSICNQGNWQCEPFSSGYAVQSTIINEGTRAIKGSGAYITKDGTPLTDGSLTIYNYANANGGFYIILQQGGGNNPSVWIDVNADVQDKIAHVNKISPYFHPTGEKITDTWYYIQIQWRNSDHTFRYNVNGGSWTDWIPAYSAWTTGIDTVKLWDVSSVHGSGGVQYFDTIQENPIGAVKTPVLIVPGLMGTEIKKGEELLWADLNRMMNPLNTDSFMDPLSFNNDLSPSILNLTSDNIIKKLESDLGLINFNYSEALITEFVNQGYVEGETLFTFSYDWRYGVTGEYADGKTNVDLLQEKIASILQQTGASKVDIIAHSMGGLIVKKHVVDNPASHHLGKAVFVGVPNTGAPKSVKVLLQGDNFDVLGLSDAEIKKISANFPAAYDLLPSQQYYDAKGSYVKVIDNGQLGAGPVTIKDLNYSEANSFLTNDHQLNSTAIAQAEVLHTASFDNFDMRTAGVDLYAIDGCTTPTITNIVESRATNIFGQKLTEYKALKWGPGDKTVPLESATNLPMMRAINFIH